MAPPEYKALHPIGAAPVIADGAITLGESAAIVEYLIATRGQGRLVVGVTRATFVDYLYWFHFANGTLQPALLRVLYAPISVASERLEIALAALDARLGRAPYLAGDALTAADIMTVFSLTTMRAFVPYDLSARAHVLAYLTRVGERSGYRRAMERIGQAG